MHHLHRGEIRAGHLAARRRVDHERPVHHRDPPARHDRHGADIRVRRVAGVRHIPSSLAGCRIEGSGGDDRFDRCLPGGPPAGARTNRPGRRPASAPDRGDRPEQPVLPRRRRRSRRSDRLLSHRRQAAAGDLRAIRLRDGPGGPRRDLPAVRTSRARLRARDSRRDIPGRGNNRQRWHQRRGRDRAGRGDD